MSETGTAKKPESSVFPPPTGETPLAVEDEKPLAAVAYVLTWVTGLIILLLAKKEQRYARWNAVQAIGLGIAGVGLGIAVGILAAVLAFVGGAAATMVLGLLNMLIWLAVVALIVLLAVKAYQGHPVRLPILAGFADKYA